MSSKRNSLQRQWSLVELLSRYRRGLTTTQILERWDGSRATLYRYIKVLRDAGVPLESHTVNGEARYTLWGMELPPLGPTPLQIAALRIARHALVGLDGTGATVEIDKLLDGYARVAAPQPIMFTKPSHLMHPNLLAALDRAIETQRQVRIRYRSVRAAQASWRTVDPLGLRFAKGDLYLVAHDHKRARPVAFKVLRITHVDRLRDKCRPHPEVELNSLFARSAKIWTGDPRRVRVRLFADAARFVHEYPLVSGQTVTTGPRGTVIVQAQVNGIPEALRWVLSWGRQAEALEPSELRRAVADEVCGAAARYVRTLPQAVSQIVRRGSVS